MTGKVKMYNEDKGYGFIAGEDGTDYFVHASAVSSAETLYRGANVSFDPGENERGKIARKVLIVQPVNRPTFIQFGDVRIKLSNIKNYGIDTCNASFVKVYEYDAQIVKEHERKQADIKKAGGLRALFYIPWSVDPYVWKGKRAYISASNKRTESFNGDVSEYWPSYKKNEDGTIELDYQKTDDEVITEQQHYLYVTTYQGDNFRFIEHETDFDIFEKCKELDKYML